MQSFVMCNVYSLVFNAAVLIFLFGFAGLMGIVAFVLFLAIRFCLHGIIKRYDEEMSGQTDNRVKQTVDVLNIIKLIKVGALEMNYYNLLVNLREI